MRTFAPVLIVTLNRYEHFKQGIESLRVNLIADKTDLFIALDYPSIEAHWIGYKEIATYANNIRGFKSVNIIKRNANYGAVKNYLESMNTILSYYDRIIFTEDDNIFSPDFLSFMNNCLDIYKDREDIFSISGYNYPINMPPSYPCEVYKWMGHSAWGFGIWKNRWDKIDFSEDVVFRNVHKFLDNLNNVIEYHNIANHYIPGLFRMLNEHKLNGDGYISMMQFINKMYSIFPVVSRVRNTGHDGSGANCGYLESDLYRKQEIYSGTSAYELPFDIETNEEINWILKKHFKRSYKTQVKIAIAFLLMKVGFYNSSNNK